MKNSINEGEMLLLLVRRSGREVKDIAKDFDVAPTSMSRMFKKQKLSSKIKKRAVAVLGVPPDYFRSTDDPAHEDAPTPEPINQEDADLWKEIADLWKEIAELKREIARLADEHRKHGTMEEKLLNIIEQLTKK